jgi:hypothetical protein
MEVRSALVARTASKKKSPAHRLPRHARILLAMAGTLASAWLIGLFEAHLWLGAAVRELGFHLTLVALGATAVALFVRLWLPAALLFVLAIAHVYPLLPLYRGALRTPQRGPVLRIATAHLSFSPLDEPALLGFLNRERPDALALTGLRPRPLPHRLGSYRITRGEGSALGVALLVQSALVAASDAPHPGLPTQLVRAGRCHARVVAVALPLLLDLSASTARSAQLETLEKAASAPRSVFVGLLGSRAEAHDLQRFAADHALRDSRLGHGRTATSPASLGPFGLPLSNVLVHGWISVRELSAAAPLVPGADRTVTSVLELTEPRCRFDRASGTE